MSIFKRFVDGPEANVPARWTGTHWEHDHSTRCDSCGGGAQVSRTREGDQLCRHCR